MKSQARRSGRTTLLLAAVLVAALGLLLVRGAATAADGASDPTAPPPAEQTTAPAASSTDAPGDPPPSPSSTAPPDAPAPGDPSPAAPTRAALSAAEDQLPPDPTEPVPPPGTGTGTVDPSIVDEVESTLLAVLDGSVTIGTTAGRGTAIDPLAVVGAFQSELEAEQLEFTAEGWVREGSYELSDVRVVSAEPAEDPTAAMVAACVDASGLTVLRADGTRVPTTPTPPATTYFALERHGEDWFVAGRSYPNDPRCDR